MDVDPTAISRARPAGTAILEDALKLAEDPKAIAEEWLITFTAAHYPEYHAWLADVFTSLKRPPQIAEEHDSATTLIAVVEAGRGVALMHEAFQCFAGPRLKIHPLVPTSPPLVVGIACRKETMAATEKFIAAVKSARDK